MHYSGIQQYWNKHMGKDNCRYQHLGFHKMIHSYFHYLFSIRSKWRSQHAIHTQFMLIRMISRYSSRKRITSVELWYYLTSLYVLSFWELRPAEGSRELNHISFIARFEFQGVCHVCKYLTCLRKLQWDNSLGRLNH